MKQMKHITSSLILWLLALHLSSQPIANPKQIENDFANDYREEWSAAWITNPDIYLSEFAVVHFRKSFELEEQPESFIIHVSADNRYRLFVNGVEVCEGPQRSDLWHWRYNTIDIAPYLQKDKNVLAAQVVNYKTCFFEVECSVNVQL